MKRLSRYAAVAVSCMLALLCSTLRAQTVNANQQVTLQGLLSTGNQGSFLAAANAADGTLYLLLNQGDGVRVGSIAYQHRRDAF